MAKVILVTGGNRGIGYEICRQLAIKGHTIILGARNTNIDVPFDADIVQLDVTNPDNIAACSRYIDQKYGKLDVLINNAGMLEGSEGSLDVELAIVRSTMETNFFAAWQLTRSCLTLLKKSDQGRIVNMSSGMGAMDGLGSGGYAAYRLSKAALNALTIQLTADLSSTNIKVNAMCPGWVRTAMGGEGAPRTVIEGADTAVWLADAREIPNGKFLRDREIIPW